MKRILLVFVLLLLPHVSDAKIWTLPSGIKYEVPDPVKITRWFTLPSGLLYWAEIHVAEAAELTLEERIRIYIISMAQKYGADSELLLKIASCESRFNPSAQGDWRSETKEFMANGLFQFWIGTFNTFKKESGLLHLKYDSWEDQAELAAWAFANKKQMHWRNCYLASR